MSLSRPRRSPNTETVGSSGGSFARHRNHAPGRRGRHPLSAARLCRRWRCAAAGVAPGLALLPTATPAVPPQVTPERRRADGQSAFREYPGELVKLVVAPARRTELAREERDRLLLADFLRLVSWQLRENSAERFDAFHSEAHLRSSVASSPVLADRSGDVARRLRRRSVSCCRIRVRSLQPEWFERRWDEARAAVDGTPTAHREEDDHASRGHRRTQALHPDLHRRRGRDGPGTPDSD